MCDSSDFSSSSNDRTRCRIPAGVYSDLPPGVIGTYERVRENTSRSDYTIDVPVNPLSNLYSHTGGCGVVRVHLRRRNRTMTMSVDPFSGNYGGMGLHFVTMNFSFKDLPYAPTTKLIALRYKGFPSIGMIKINPDDMNNKITIHHSFLANEPSELGANLDVEGFTVEWVIKENNRNC